MKRFRAHPTRIDSAEAVGAGLTIKVYDKINDPELVHAWTRIEKDFDYFPQSSHGWCAAWWKRLAGKLELHVAAVFDETGSIVGIAPLCIEKKIGMRSLRSFPIHFADFYTFVIVRDNNYEAVYEVIINHLLSFSEWDIVRLDQVNSEDKMYDLLRVKRFRCKKLTDIISADLERKSFEEYLQTLSGNRRKDMTKKVRRLERDSEVELIKLQDNEGYLSYFDQMKNIYNDRWGEDDNIILTDKYYACRNEAVASCFNEGKMLLYVLKADGNVIAFHLGFNVSRTFYTWKESHNPAYSYYSPGALIKFYLIRDLIRSGFSRINFMAGDYEFKRTLSKDGVTNSNYVFFAAKSSLRGWLLFQYYLKWRDLLKLFYHGLMAKVTIVKKKIGASRSVKTI